MMVEHEQHALLHHEASELMRLVIGAHPQMSGNLEATFTCKMEAESISAGSIQQVTIKKGLGTHQVYDVIGKEARVDSMADSSNSSNAVPVYCQCILTALSKSVHMCQRATGKSAPRSDWFE